MVAFTHFLSRTRTREDVAAKLSHHDISSCLQQVKAAEEALVGVREALSNMEKSAGDSHYVQMEMARDDVASPESPKVSHPEILKDPSRRSAKFDLDALGGAEHLAQKHGISAEDVQRCAKAFSECDVKGCGRVCTVELNILLQEACGIKVSQSEIENIMERYDLDHSGDFSFEQFLKFYCDTPLFKATNLDNCISAVGQQIRQQMEDERMTPHDRADAMGVSAKAITAYLRREIAEAGACFQMPIAVCMLLFFALSVFLHMRIEETHGVDAAISWDLTENANFAFSGEIPFENGRMGHKSIGDVNTIADFWSWFNLGLVPLFWPEGWDMSEVHTNAAARCVSLADNFHSHGYNKTKMANMPNNSTRGDTCPESFNQPRLNRDFWAATPNRSDYLFFHTIIGGLRMEQELTLKTPCPAADKGLEKFMRTDTCLKDIGYWLKPEVSYNFRMQSEYVDSPGAETQYLLSRLPQSQIREQLRALENRAWLNPRSSKVSLMFMIYNSHMDLLTAVYITFFLNRGGHIHKMVEPVSLWLHPYHGWWNYMFDAMWTSLVAILCLHESREFGQHCYQLGIRRGTSVYFTLSNAVDWLSVLYSLVIICFWLSMQYMLVDISELLKKGDVARSGTWIDEQDRLSMFEQTTQLIDNWYTFRAILAWYPFVIISRLFKAFALQPRLAMVTKTMSQASTDIFHFMVVFGSIFVIYATSAMILFGQAVPHFASFGRAITAIFRILLGDFEWDQMSRVGRLRANVWFWSFVWLVQLTMLNMLLAVVMDVYTEVKGGMGNAETMWSQLSEIYCRARAVRNGQAMDLGKILKTLDPTDLDGGDDDAVMAMQFYTVTTFCQAIPGLRKEQAREILIDSQQRLEDDQRSSTSLTDTALTVQKMADLLWKLHAAVQELFHMSEMNASLIKHAAGKERMIASPNTQEGDERGEREEKENTQSRHQAIIPELQVLRDVIDTFHKQHDETEDMLNKYGEQLCLTASRNAHQPEPAALLRPVQKPKPLFPSICASPRVHKRSAVADSGLSPSFTRLEP